VEHRFALHYLVISIASNLSMDINRPTIIVGNKTKSAYAVDNIVLANLANSHLHNFKKKQKEAAHWSDEGVDRFLVYELWDRKRFGVALHYVVPLPKIPFCFYYRVLQIWHSAVGLSDIKQQSYVAFLHLVLGADGGRSLWLFSGLQRSSIDVLHLYVAAIHWNGAFTWSEVHVWEYLLICSLHRCGFKFSFIRLWDYENGSQKL
jgi:hypothetical protein